MLILLLMLNTWCSDLYHPSGLGKTTCGSVFPLCLPKVTFAHGNNKLLAARYSPFGRKVDSSPGLTAC